jgi:hypothetical protein
MSQATTAMAIAAMIAPQRRLPLNLNPEAANGTDFTRMD